MLDLESTNGTMVNGQKVPPARCGSLPPAPAAPRPQLTLRCRYYRLLEKDVLKFGFSSREYVLMCAAADGVAASAAGGGGPGGGEAPA